MERKSRVGLASTALLSLVLTTAFNGATVKAEAGKVTRTSGATRYKTAAKLATENWTTSKNVVLVSGEGYADAISASALAKKLDSPILLTTPDKLDPDAKAAIQELKAEKVYVVGGEASVSKTIRDELKTMTVSPTDTTTPTAISAVATDGVSTITLSELSGKDRYETNVAIAKELVAQLGVSAEDVMMVGGGGFADALSVAPVAATKGQILLLASNNTDSMKPVKDFVDLNKSKVTLVATENVINKTTFSSLPTGATRINGGADRFETNLKILEAFEEDLNIDKAYIANASGERGFADALVASALAGKYGAPLVLVGAEKEEGTADAIDYLKTILKPTTDVQVLGGTGVVPETLITTITSAIPTDETTTPSSITVE